MQDILDELKKKCRLSSRSRFVDVGSGLGKPNFHAAQDPNVCVSVGIESEYIRHILAQKNLSHILADKSDSSSVAFTHMDAALPQTLNPFTHVYQFDLGFEPSLQASIAEKFNGRCVGMSVQVALGSLLVLDVVSSFHPFPTTMPPPPPPLVLFFLAHTQSFSSLTDPRAQ